VQLVNTHHQIIDAVMFAASHKQYMKESAMKKIMHDEGEETNEKQNKEEDNLESAGGVQRYQTYFMCLPTLFEKNTVYLSRTFCFSSCCHWVVRSVGVNLFVVILVCRYGMIILLGDKDE
jgi:hypothetical protein